MSISVNDVYQKVLAIANKEQRGYVTPLEFNLFADHAQKDIFRQYFHDLDQAMRRPGNSTNYADIATTIEEKISMFELHDVSVSASNQSGDVDLSSLQDMYKLTLVNVNYSLSNNENFLDAQQVQLKQIGSYNNSPLIRNITSHTYKECYYSVTSDSGSQKKIKLYPSPGLNDEINISYIKKPSKPNWTYVISGESALFNKDVNAGWNDFELHPSEENLLVIKILQLAGVSIKDYNLTQVAAQEEVKKIQQEKA